jgi:hypothetical protein
VDDAQASLRAALTVELVACQFALESALADLSNAEPAVRDQLRSQLSLIAGLRQQVGAAQGSNLSILRAEVTALASSAAAAAQEARTSAAASTSASGSIATLAHAAHEQVNTVMAGMKDFDGFLHFGPGDTEADYRKREAERRATIAAEQAKGTPQGDLNASGAAVGQMVDAKAHGAGDSPEFQQRWDTLVATTEALRAEIIRQGGSTKEFDERLREDLRRTLKSKGLTDADIDAQFAAHPGNPLEAAKAYVAEGDVATIDRSVQRVGNSITQQPAQADAQPTTELANTDVMAKFRSTGIVLADAAPTGDFTHGVTTQRSNAASRIIPG